ncbi:MAG: GNAT family N-acetyltransferase [Saccharofermentans sp.]|nr:GNAT family N-acetyltransferase [Saccharofermentans sp.]
MQIREYSEYNEDEIVSLYSDAGWIAYMKDTDSMKKGYENSLLILGAYDGDDLMGIVRVVGDGHTIVFVQNLLVYNRYQRQGVGTALLKAVLERYRDVRQIELVTDDTDKTKAFYGSVGFRPLDDIGCCGFMRC